MQARAPTIEERQAPERIKRLGARVGQARADSLLLAQPLSAEDCCAQSMPDASPAKWHLAHASWFFETFVLLLHLPGYGAHDAGFAALFNSYYDALGPQYPRARRGLLTRPDLPGVLSYRLQVDDALMRLLERPGLPEAALDLIELGMHHERQHQELLLTDVKHLLAQHPQLPAYRSGLVEIGDAGTGFAFDNERPRHRRWLNPHRLALQPVNNAEYREFVEDGGYRRAELWLADGWRLAQERNWQRPLYWDAQLAQEYTLGGLRPLDLTAPVCHVSFYEADAYARWRGARLPDEAEWEAAAEAPVAGNFLELGLLHPRAPTAPGHRQFFGEVWEWTASAYRPYPGFAPAAGAVGEYNGKFMINQMVLRGGSCVSHSDHLRSSYRNFFYPDARWQFSGIRLAQDR